MLEILQSGNQYNYNHNGTTYLRISMWNPSYINTMDQYAAIIITSTEKEHALEILNAIRLHNSTSIYLMPIWVLDKTFSTVSIHFDGVFNPENANEQVKKTHDKISMVASSQHHISDRIIEQKFLNYLYTRSGKIIPIKDRLSKSGYAFPFIDLLTRGDEYERFKALRLWEQEALIKGRLYDRIQLCQECSDAFLMFKEVCPKCNSLDIKAQDIIHHFPCAHVAPKQQFQSEKSDHLECPKCDKQLRHIGIDYDKPSVVHSCNNCNHSFQQASMVAECHSCHTQNKLTELIEVDVKEYTLSLKAISQVENGVSTDVKSKQAISQKTIFDQLVHQERSRTFVKGRGSFAVELTFEGKLFSILSADFLSKFWTEIDTIVDAYILNPIYKCRENQTIELLLIDIENDKVDEIIEKLQYNMKIIIEDNIGKDIQVICTMARLG